MRRFSSFILCVLLLAIVIVPNASYATVDNVTARNNYTGNGSTKAFPYTFRILVASDLLVVVGGVTKALNSDYSVSGVGAQNGGTVTLTVAPAPSVPIILTRNIPIVQTTDYIPNQAINANTLETNFDRLTMIAQMLSEQIADRNLDNVGSSITGGGAANRLAYWTANTTLAGTAFHTLHSSGGIDTNINGPPVVSLYPSAYRVIVKNNTPAAGGIHNAANFQMYTGNCPEFNSTPVPTDLGGLQASAIRCPGAPASVAMLGADIYTYTKVNGGPVTTIVANTLYSDDATDGGPACTTPTNCGFVSIGIISGRSGSKNTSVAFAVHSEPDGQRWYHGYLLNPNTIHPSGTGLWFQKSQAANFILMQPSDNTGGVAVRITNAELTAERLNIFTDGRVHTSTVTTGGPLSPQYSFIEDTNTGMYWGGADTLGFTVGGIARAIISTTSITSALSIAPNIDNTLALGAASLRWSSVNATRYDSGGLPGVSATTTVRDAAGTGTCTLIYTGGIRTGGSC